MNCVLIKSKEDGLSLRCIGDWSIEKMKYFDDIATKFSTGMKYKWENRYYIDLFSGPGRCILKGTGREIWGSPINAINVKDKFTKYYFVDINEQCVKD